MKLIPSNQFLFSLFALVFSLITACSNTKTTTSTSKPPSSSQKDIASKKTPAPNKKTPSSTDLKTRKLIIKEAEKHKGVPYKYAGKNPQGFDCSGFTYYVYGKHNIQLSGSSNAQAKQGKEIPIAKAKNGDLLFFGREGRTGRIQHVGLVYKNTADGLYMIHSSSKRGIVIDNVTTSKYWKPKLLFARRVLKH